MPNFCGKCGSPTDASGLCPKCDAQISEPTVESILKEEKTPAYPWLFRDSSGGKTVASVFLCILLTIVMIGSFSVATIKVALSEDSIEEVVEEIPAMETALSSIIEDLCSDFEYSENIRISEADKSALSLSPSFKEFISDELCSFINSAVSGKYWSIEEAEIYAALVEAKVEMNLDMDDYTIRHFANWTFSGGRLSQSANESLGKIDIPKPISSVVSGPAVFIMFGIAFIIVIGLILINFSKGINCTGIAFIISSVIVSIPILVLKIAASSASHIIVTEGGTNAALDTISETDTILKIIDGLLTPGLLMLAIFLVLGIALLIVRKPLLKLFRSITAK